MIKVGGFQKYPYSFKNFINNSIWEGKSERESPKRTISASGGSGLLQMVSEPDTGRCVSLLAVPRRG